MDLLKIAAVFFTFSPHAQLMAESATVERERATVERTLESRRVSLDLDEAPLSETLALMRGLTGVNFVISPSVHETRGELTVSLRVTDLSARSALDLILELNQLQRTVQHGVVIVSTGDASEEKPRLQMYDVRDIIMVVRDMPGPSIELAEAEDGPSIVIIDDEPVHSITDEDTLVSLVEDNVDPDSWSEEGRSIALRNGLLIVSQGAKQHLEILQLLGDLRGGQ